MWKILEVASFKGLVTGILMDKVNFTKLFLRGGVLIEKFIKLNLFYDDKTIKNKRYFE